MKGEFIFLGTGASPGVPVIGCGCSVCKSTSLYNHRLRSASLLRIGSQQILIDVGPDFRHQALKMNLTSLDGLILTHAHYDHIAGFDDLRVFSFIAKQPLPVLLSQDTMRDLGGFFSYLLEEKKSPKFIFEILDRQSGQVNFQGLKIGYCSYGQTGMRVTGYRFGDLAFITDIKDYSSEIFDEFSDCHVLIISALDWTPTRAHISLEEAIDIGRHIKAQRTIITHIGHELAHEETTRRLPKGVELAYDGMSVPFNIG